jgi:transposase
MNSASKKPSYMGKDVFIGIDVHKRTYSVVSVVEGTVVKKCLLKRLQCGTPFGERF